MICGCVYCFTLIITMCGVLVVCVVRFFEIYCVCVLNIIVFVNVLSAFYGLCSVCTICVVCVCSVCCVLLFVVCQFSYICSVCIVECVEFVVLYLTTI